MDDYIAFDDDSMGGLGDYMKLQQLYDEVEQEIEELRQHDYDAADNEAQYRMMLSSQTASERIKGTPVTVIENLVRGEEPIAMAKVRWKKAEADARASNHLIFFKKDQIEMLKEIIKHEMFRPSNA